MLFKHRHYGTLDLFEALLRGRVSFRGFLAFRAASPAVTAKLDGFAALCATVFRATPL